MINGHLDSWLGYKVELYDEAAAGVAKAAPKKKGWLGGIFGENTPAAPVVRKMDYKNTVYRLAVDYDCQLSVRDLLQRFSGNPASVETPAIIIGSFAGGDSGDDTTESIVEALAAAHDKFPKLRGIFLGDIVGEECEISWIQQSEVSPLLIAYPGLEHFRVRGANSLSFGKVRHENLKTLVVESGGMSKELVEQIGQCEFPNLEHLELWLGTEGYGWNGSLTDVLPFLDSAKYPKLKYLGLKNSDIQDDIAAAVVRSNILPQLQALDLSMGVLTDVGGKALLECDEIGQIHQLDLHHHYLSEEVQNELRAKNGNVNLSDAQKEEEEDRYVAVGE